MITFTDLLRQTFPEPVTWLSAEGEAAQPIHWVTTSLEEIQPGDLLLLPGQYLNPDCINRALDLGAHGLLVFGKDIPTSFQINADIPVALLPSNDELRAVLRALLATLIDQKASLIARAVSIQEQLSQLAAEGQGLDGLAGAMAGISGHGVLVQDKRLQILAERPSPSLLSTWGDIVHQLRSSDSLPVTFKDRKQAGKQTLVIQQDLPVGLTRLIAPIIVGEVARGFLSLLATQGELDQLDHLVAEQGALVCAFEMSRTKAIREAEKRLQGDLLAALLQENLAPRDALLWAQNLNLDLSQALVAMRFAWDGPSPPSRRRLETLINGEITRQNLPVLISPMGSEVICFYQVHPGSDRPETAIAFAQTVISLEVGEYPGTVALCGIGAPCQDLSDWRTSFQQSGQALELARRLGGRKALYFPDLSVYRLLMQIKPNPELAAFLEEILGPLIAHDGGVELIHTLETYFDHNANLSQTAEALFIHRNTLIYRMERIAEISGVDLNHPETRLAVQIALRIYRMMGARPVKS
jgi:PucR family transcriptional regulator, purine catabolism regulatory protein